MCRGRSAFGKRSAPGSGMTGTWCGSEIDGSMEKIRRSILRYGIEAVRKPSQVSERQLAGRGRRTEISVVENAATAGQLQPRNPSHFSDAHGHNVRGAAL